MVNSKSNRPSICFVSANAYGAVTNENKGLSIDVVALNCPKSVDTLNS